MQSHQVEDCNGHERSPRKPRNRRSANQRSRYLDHLDGPELCRPPPNRRAQHSANTTSGTEVPAVHRMTESEQRQMRM